MQVYNSVAALNSTAGMETQYAISKVYANPLRGNSLDFLLLSNHSPSFLSFCPKMGRVLAALCPSPLHPLGG